MLGRLRAKVVRQHDQGMASGSPTSRIRKHCAGISADEDRTRTKDLFS